MAVVSGLVLIFWLATSALASADTCGKCSCTSRVMDCSGRGIGTVILESPQSNITELWLEHNSLSNISAAAFASFDNLQRLYLRNNHISYIDADAFEGLENLQYLDLSYNAISEVPEPVFRNLPYLQRLIFHKNQISELTFLLRIQNCSLTTINLFENALSTIPSKAFYRCSHLRQLNLAANKLASLAKDAFAGLEELEQLDLSGNDIPSLPSEVFQPLSSLRILDVSRNEVALLPKGLFTPLKSARAIDVSYNWLSSIPAWTFVSCLSLRRLSLNDNLISSVHPNAFVAIPALPPPRTPASIHPQCANITMRDSNIGLQHLDLSNNQLHRMDAASLIAFPDLEVLRLEGNLITTFGPDLVCAAATIGEGGSGLHLGNTGLKCACGPLKDAYSLSRKIAPKFNPVCLHSKTPWITLDRTRCPAKASKKTASEKGVAEVEVRAPSHASGSNAASPALLAAPPSPELAPSPPSTATSGSTVHAGVIAPILAIAFFLSLAAMAVSVFRVYRRARYDVPEAEEGLRMMQYGLPTHINSINNVTRL